MARPATRETKLLRLDPQNLVHVCKNTKTKRKHKHLVTIMYLSSWLSKFKRYAAIAIVRCSHASCEELSNQMHQLLCRVTLKASKTDAKRSSAAERIKRSSAEERKLSAMLPAICQTYKSSHGVSHWNLLQHGAYFYLIVRTWNSSIIAACMRHLPLPWVL